MKRIIIAVILVIICIGAVGCSADRKDKTQTEGTPGRTDSSITRDYIKIKPEEAKRRL